MSKGIIVVDIPENCLNCDLRSASGYCLRGRRDIFKFGMMLDKTKECPIKPLPVYRDERYTHYDSDYYRAEGWNSCLDALLEDDRW